MDVSSIIDGLEAELALERELGVRVIEIDRALLQERESRPAPPVQPVASPAPPITGRQSLFTPLDFLFLHDKALSKGGIEMMAKIVTAMKKTPETAPIVFTGERPAAKVCVVLGSAALKKWFPTLRGAPGQWLRGPEGENVLVTYSPEYILRMGPATPAVREIKMKMWTSLKGVLQRIGI